MLLLTTFYSVSHVSELSHRGGGVKTKLLKCDSRTGIGVIAQGWVKKTRMECFKTRQERNGLKQDKNGMIKTKQNNGMI